jgi:hypothetical protein
MSLSISVEDRVLGLGEQHLRALKVAAVKGALGTIEQGSQLVLEGGAVKKCLQSANGMVGGHGKAPG